MIVFRLGIAKHSYDLTGRGAELTGQRWNSKGVAVLYTSSSVALCVTELAVHAPLSLTPIDYCLTEIEISNELAIFELPKHLYPKDWRENPPPFDTKKLGDTFIREGKFVVMRVSSAVVPNEFNYLINPKHKDFHRVKILKVVPFIFDKRLKLF